jgi:putative Mn2+ efflux pump MntP
MRCDVATHVGFALLAPIGFLIIRKSNALPPKQTFDTTRGTGLLVTSFSISLDSLGIGIALSTVGIPLLPLLVIASITTTGFTFIGLEFGARQIMNHSA